MQDELKKNDVYIQKVRGFQASIEECIKYLGVKNVSFEKIKETIKNVMGESGKSFNNREMSIVSTKLQEASHWAGRNDTDRAYGYLCEAFDWCGEYIKVLE